MFTLRKDQSKNSRSLSVEEPLPISMTDAIKSRLEWEIIRFRISLWREVWCQMPQTITARNKKNTWCRILGNQRRMFVTCLSTWPPWALAGPSSSLNNRRTRSKLIKHVYEHSKKFSWMMEPRVLWCELFSLEPIHTKRERKRKGSNNKRQKSKKIFARCECVLTCNPVVFGTVNLYFQQRRKSTSQKSQFHCSLPVNFKSTFARSECEHGSDIASGWVRRKSILLFTCGGGENRKKNFAFFRCNWAFNCVCS